MRLSDVFVIVM